ncbi:tyrosine-protein phosphatase [Pseudonocardia sediminis]|uniref:tyrosine-protein phosphatase n=1 Tax=Pseudonocardia sediminis TaxID=1397368 RepID=UPI0013EF06A7|nr:tyrosine-protein phosphatase [Pseudonocardia sediminis]
MTASSLLRTARPANLRDVGGLSTVEGFRVRPGLLYRGDAPQPGDPRTARAVGLDAALTWPPAVVIDLRSEVETGPSHPLDDVARVHHIPLGASLAPEKVAATPTADRDITWAYRLLVTEAGPSLARIVGLVAQAPGPVFVHCAAGKDRTGIVIGTVLAALGVPREQIVADYLRTNDNLDALWARLRAAGAPEPDHDSLLGVEAAALEVVLDELADRPGGVHGRLLDAGTDPSDLRLLSERLLTADDAPGRPLDA